VLLYIVLVKIVNRVDEGLQNYIFGAHRYHLRCVLVFVPVPLRNLAKGLGSGRVVLTPNCLEGGLLSVGIPLNSFLYLN